MPRRSMLLPVRARVAAAVLAAAGATLLPVSAAPAAATASTGASDDAPLSLTIDQLTPSSIPQKGKVRISGWVTNDSDETWTAINVHAFISDDPITDSSDLAFESTRGPEEFVGDRITVPGTFATIASLAPGQTAPYTDRIPVSVLDVTEPGVYWFGVHALGTSSAGRDSVADGRARTFLPYVPRQGRGKPIDTALVLPIRHQVLHESDGKVADEGAWARTLAAGGQLSSILDFGAAAGSRPLTWLVDPAVTSAVSKLRAGNPPRDLVEGAGDSGDAGSTASPSPSAGDPTSTNGSPSTSAEGDATSVTAEQWLVRFQQALTDKQVLGLPWGDVDVAAAAKRAPEVLTDARASTGSTLTQGSFPMSPAVAPPSGHLDDAALAATDAATTVLVSDKSVVRGQSPSVASYAGRTLVLYSSEVLAGGPGPDDPHAQVALRQRILSEAALRMNEPGRAPLVVEFPPGWMPPEGPDYAAFWDGLDVNWMHLTTLSEATAVAPRPLAADRYSYPQWQLNHEVGADAFGAINDLTDEATRLQAVLTDQSDLAARLRQESFGDVSSYARDDDGRAQLVTEATTGWVRDQLGRISVSAPRRVILSSNSGNFSVTVTNGLAVPVSVRIRATASPPMRITTPGTIVLGAGSTRTTLLQASTDRLGVHSVTVSLTDPEGSPLGSSDVVPVRAAQVSRIIWLILAVAVALLLVAIATRLVRRIRGGGSGDAGGDGDPPPPDDPSGRHARQPADHLTQHAAGQAAGP